MGTVRAATTRRAAAQIRPSFRTGEIVGLPAVLDDPERVARPGRQARSPGLQIPIQPRRFPAWLNTAPARMASARRVCILGSPLAAIHAADGRIQAVRLHAGRHASRLAL